MLLAFLADPLHPKFSGPLDHGTTISNRTRWAAAGKGGLAIQLPNHAQASIHLASRSNRVVDVYCVMVRNVQTFGTHGNLQSDVL